MLCLSQVATWDFQCRGLLVLNGFSGEVVARYVDIGGIVYK